MISRLQNIGYTPINLITVGERLRRRDAKFQQAVEEKMQSLLEFGPFQPLLIDEDNNLIDGGTRLEAYIQLGEIDVPAVVAVGIDAATKMVMEMEANDQRSPLSWQERAVGIYKIHTAESAKYEDWSTRATGSLFKISHASVAQAVIFAKELIRGDKELWECDTAQAGRDVLLKRREAAVTASLAQLNQDAFKVKTPAPTKAGPGILNITLGTPGTAPAPVAERKKDHLPANCVTRIPISTMLFHADCHTFMENELKPFSIDHIVTDPPYAIEMSNLEGMQNLESTADEHEVGENLDQLPKFIENSYRVLKADGFLIFFCAFQHWEKMRDWGNAAGFKVQDWPLIWAKPHGCKNNAPHANWTKSIEPVMVMRKGKANLRMPMNKCHMECDATVDRMCQSHPFAKPHQWLSEMIWKPIVAPGTTIYDPYMGGGSILRSAILNGARVIGTEKKEHHYVQAMESIKSVYTQVQGKHVEFC